ncbi:MAG: DNA mismatch endonuclease Vsr [Sorangiineae bacterium PRO1]|nr:DNA mismatch endonuclease Vsr [Sorangiineae bacterium PRO1]
MDTVSPEVRSRMMASIRGHNTRPELAVRRAMHAAGLRFRLHRKDLPGKPDLVFPRYRTVVFVHGCFWHRHAGCEVARLPEANRDWWKEKFRRNRMRDSRQQRALRRDGWNVIVVWECELQRPRTLSRLARAIRTGRALSG